MSRIALVAGGTGLVGGHLVKIIVDSNEFREIKVLIRKGNKFEMDGITSIEVDYDHLINSERYLKADCVFCCLGTTIKKAGSKEKFQMVDYTYPHELAKITLQNGSRQFNVITASGANSKSMFFYNRLKGDIEHALKNLGYENLNIFRPSLLLGDRNEKRLGEEIGALVAKTVNPLLMGNLKKLRAIQAETVAKAMVEVSLRKYLGARIFESYEIQELGQL